MKPEKRNPESEEEFVEGDTIVKSSDVCAKIMAPKSEVEVLDAFAKGKAKYGKVTGTLLASLWSGLHRVYLPKLQMPGLLNKQMAQLKLAYKQTEDEFVPALVTVLTHWAEFVDVAKLYGGAVKASAYHGQKIPTTGFVLQHVQTMVIFHREKLSQLTAPKSEQPVAGFSPAPGTTLTQLLKPTASSAPEALPTLSEAMAILYGTDDAPA